MFSNGFNKISRLVFGTNQSLLDIAEQGQMQSKHLTPPSKLVCLSQLYDGKSFKAIILGRRISGRSGIVKQLLKSAPTNDPVLIFHGRESICPVYGNDDDLQRRKVVVRSRYESKVLQTFSEIHQKHPVTVVFDNCFDIGWNKDRQIEWLMETDANVIFVIDHPMILSHRVKSLCNFLFLFKENIYLVRRKIYENWNLRQVFSSIHVYDQMYASATNVPYGYLLVDLSRETCYVGRTLVPVGQEEDFVGKVLKESDKNLTG
jgi:hypothetical protein